MAKITPQLSSAVSVGYTTDIWSSMPMMHIYLSLLTLSPLTSNKKATFLPHKTCMPEKHTGVHIGKFTAVAVRVGLGEGKW